MITMITQEQAEEIATRAMQEYVSKCQCNSTEDVANALMKMASICGVGMVAVVGHKDAVDRMQATTDFIDKTLNGVNYRFQKAH